MTSTYFVLLIKLAKCLETICILCLYIILNVPSICVNYLRLKNTVLCWRKCIRILFKIWITHMDILWLMAKLASEIWTQPGGDCTLPEQCNYVLQAYNGELKLLCVVELWKYCQYHSKEILHLLEMETEKQDVLIRGDLLRDWPRFVSSDKEQR